jgi:pyridoxal phosphate enzyme (YggS family)
MLQENLTEIKSRIAAAASRVNRAPADIKLVAVTKRVLPENIIRAIELDHYVFGENYVQESLEKIPYIKAHHTGHKISFHFIGKLQSNKAPKAAELFDVIESVDTSKLANILDRHCATLNKPLNILIQVNIAREKQKSGVMPEDCEILLQNIRQCSFLRVMGLMAMPPYFPDPEDARPYFKQLRQLSNKMQANGLLGQHGPVELSMGMSGDFEVAIEEGATEVRIGTAIFGTRTHI